MTKCLYTKSTTNIHLIIGKNRRYLELLKNVRQCDINCAFTSCPKLQNHSIHSILCVYTSFLDTCTQHSMARFNVEHWLSQLYVERQPVVHATNTPYNLAMSQQLYTNIRTHLFSSTKFTTYTSSKHFNSTIRILKTEYDKGVSTARSSLFKKK